MCRENGDNRRNSKGIRKKKNTILNNKFFVKLYTYVVLAKTWRVFSPIFFRSISNGVRFAACWKQEDISSVVLFNPRSIVICLFKYLRLRDLRTSEFRLVYNGDNKDRNVPRLYVYSKAISAHLSMEKSFSGWARKENILRVPVVVSRKKKIVSGIHARGYSFVLFFSFLSAKKEFDRNREK